MPNVNVTFDSNTVFGARDKAILKKLSVGGNISGKKDNRKEGNFYFF